MPMTGSVLSGSGQNSHLAASGMSRWAAPSPAATLILGHQLLLLQQKQQREQDLLRLAASSGSGPRQSLNPNLSLPGISSSMLPGESRRLCGGLTGNRGLSGVNGPNSGSVSTLLQSLRATVATESTVSSPPFHPNSFVRQEFNDDVRLLEQQPLPTPLLPLQMPRVVFPVILAAPSDGNVLSDHQSYLRQQIQVFQATNEDVNTPVRGRNKRIYMGQVGIRCRHCAHLPVEMRQLGSVYFPLSMMGFYQAAQNMCSTHIQCGKCSELSDEVKDEFIRLLALKTLTSTGGRRYWAEQLRQMGLVDTDKGVFSVREVPRDVQVIPMGSGMSSVSGKRKAVAAGKPRSMGVKAAPGRAKAPKSHTA